MRLLHFHRRGDRLLEAASFLHHACEIGPPLLLMLLPPLIEVTGVLMGRVPAHLVQGPVGEALEPEAQVLASLPGRRRIHEPRGLSLLH